MATVLPLVHELHSPAMRDRHWKSLMILTGTVFEKGPGKYCHCRSSCPYFSEERYYWQAFVWII
jgi:hypothetical protein